MAIYKFVFVTVFHSGLTIHSSSCYTWLCLSESVLFTLGEDQHSFIVSFLLSTGSSWSLSILQNLHFH